MEQLVRLVEKFVGDSPWRLLAFVVAFLLCAVVGLWGYEYFTARSRMARLEFAVDHLKKVSDPELKKNVQGDPKLEEAHSKMKDNLNEYLAQTQVDVSIPEPALRFVAAILPMGLIGLLALQSTERSQVGSLLLSVLVLSGLYGVLALVLIPPTWPGWLKYSLPTAGIIGIGVLLVTLQKVRSRSAASKPT